MVLLIFKDNVSWYVDRVVNRADRNVSKSEVILPST